MLFSVRKHSAKAVSSGFDIIKVNTNNNVVIDHKGK